MTDLVGSADSIDSLGDSSGKMINNKDIVMKRIILCADDYGQAALINEAILALIRLNRITATTCLVNFQDWHVAAKPLHVFQGKIDIGLHINLTEGAPLSVDFMRAYGKVFPTLPKLMSLAMLHRLNGKVIEAECHAQLDHFLAGMHAYPCFIDGHQHVHQLPVIRDALLRVYQTRLKQHPIYMRVVNPTYVDCPFSLKAFVIHLSGGKAFHRLLKQHHVLHNESFSGIYSFRQAKRYAAIFPRFLQAIHDQGIIMCHPGLAPLQRGYEYTYLQSGQFLSDLAMRKITLTRFDMKV